MNKIKYYLFGFLLFVFIFFTTIEFYALNNNFYFREYKKNNVYVNINHSKEDIKKATYNITNYLKNKEKTLHYKDIFSDQEKKHMDDVRVLFNKGLKIRMVTLVSIIAIVFMNLKRYDKLIYYGTRSLILINLFFLLLCFLVSLNYDKAFTLFHNILFNNDLWLLSPKESIIINLLPIEFFIDISIHILITNLFINIIIISLFTYVTKKVKV